ncbi:sigma 54-interacting transcriptional regulator [Paraburkholderia sp. B3]|uniref:sigma-54 dependent transcriptional regulator n=1 Tax=Paraburkholderia sp. B3 TaxID=3134791 RepID=UPI003982A47F
MSTSAGRIPGDSSGNRRPLVYATRSPLQGLLGELRKRAWTVSVVSDVSEIGSSNAKRRVGILDLSDISHDAAARLSNVCGALSDRVWVALIKGNQIDDPCIRTLLYEHCFDYVTVPTDVSRIVDVVGHAYGMASLQESKVVTPVADESESGMVGSCEAMRELYDVIQRVARTDAPALVTGETGSGKELTAVAIHRQSPRRAEPFVAINFAAIPSHLVQSALFGHERGAFTGATLRKIGYIEAANGGTLFLDEIGDLPLDSQGSLLRFLQEQTIRRVGATKPIPVDVRIVAATHVDLERATEEGRFRADLYHRLCVLHVKQPPLRSRGEDIGLLAQHMFERYRSDAPQQVRGFSAEALDALYLHAWPGNVRELINRVRRSLVMARGRLITAEDLDLPRYGAQAPLTVAQAKEALEREAIELALKRNRGRAAGAARDLQISRATLYRRMEAFGIVRGRRSGSD